MSRRITLLFVALMLVVAPAWAQPAAPAAKAPAAQAAAPVKAQAPVAPATDNPLLQEWTTPFKVPPYQLIKPEHFLPAIKEGIAQNRKEIDAIVNNPQPPTFANTIEALENAGELLSKVQGAFGGLTSAETNPQLQAVNREATPLLSTLRDEVRLNEKLFQRVKSVYDNRATLKLTPLQNKLVEEVYKGYVRAGANLDAAKKEQLKKINAEMSMLTLKFGDNQLHDTNAYKLVIEKQEDLKGLPPSVVATAADAAQAAKMPGKWVFTLQAPSIWPFLQVLRQPRPSAPDHRRVHQPRRSQRRVGQQEGPGSHRGAARGARAADGLQDVRRLRPRREHGEDAGGRVQPAEPAVDAGAQRGAEGSGRHAGDDRQGRREPQARGG